MAFPLVTAAGALLAGLLLVALGIGWDGPVEMLRERLFLVGLSAVAIGWVVGLVARLLHRDGAEETRDGRAFWTGVACGIAPWSWFTAGFALVSVALAWRRPLRVPGRALLAVGVLAHLLPVVVALTPPSLEPTPLAEPDIALPAMPEDLPAADGPDVLLVVVDTLRADAILDPGIPTPHLDALRARGAWAEAAVAPCNQTLPSHLALLCGLDIERVGMRSNLSRWPTSDQLRAEQGMRPLAERFHEAGWRTAAVVSNALLSSTDVEAGHQDFAAGFEAWNGMQRAGTWMLFRDWYRRYTLIGALTPHRLISYPVRKLLSPRDVEVYRDHFDEGRRTTDAALPWLDTLQQGSAPYFFLLHYMDPHSPYVPPEPYRGTLATADERPAGFGDSPLAELPMRVHLLDGIKGDGLPEDSAEVAHFLHELYREEVAAFDAQVGRVLQQVEASGRPTVVLFTSDHGEQFLEHGWTEHSHTLFDEEVLVPFVVAGPGVPEGVKLDEVPELVDAAPTLLALAGLPSDAVSGQDLFLPRTQVRRPALSVMTDAMTLREERWKLHAAVRYLDKEDPAPGAYEVMALHLFDVQADPGEAVDLKDAHPDQVERLLRVLEARMADDFYPELPKRVLSESKRDQLAALGYAGTIEDDHKH